MLTVLAYLMIIVFMALIMTKRLPAVVALIVVPIIFGLIAGFDDDMPLRLQCETQHRTQRVLVLDEEDGRVCRSSRH